MCDVLYYIFDKCCGCLCALVFVLLPETLTFMNTWYTINQRPCWGYVSRKLHEVNAQSSEVLQTGFGALQMFIAAKIILCLIFWMSFLAFPLITPID